MDNDSLTQALRRLVLAAETEARMAALSGMLAATAAGAGLFDDAPAAERTGRVDRLRALAVGLLAHVLVQPQPPGAN